MEVPNSNRRFQLSETRNTLLLFGRDVGIAKLTMAKMMKKMAAAKKAAPKAMKKKMSMKKKK